MDTPNGLYVIYDLAAWRLIFGEIECGPHSQIVDDIKPVLGHSHNGHGIGLNVHERPIINPHEDIPYEPGMITTVETRMRWVGRLGYHMEDIIEITGTEPIWHARHFPNEELFVI